MIPKIEPSENGLQTLRLVVDAIQECNLRCLYCHPGSVWIKQHIDTAVIRDLFVAVDNYGLLELVLSGGEVTMHPQLPALLEATHLVQRPTVTLITNATLLSPEVIDAIAASNVLRICVSIDGVNNNIHGTARGKNLPRVLEGLRAIQDLGREVTVISVAHRHNFRNLTQLSMMLADHGLASQHHMCAPSYSGTAREHYADLRLDPADYLSLQHEIDQIHMELKARGFFVTFNSFWPATGQRSRVVDGGRTITLQQLVEQQKDSLIHVRPNGEFRLAVASWGRETVGRSDIGNIMLDDPRELMSMADALFRSKDICQLPRNIEAIHKFQINGLGTVNDTNVIIDSSASATSLIDAIPVTPLSKFELLNNPLKRADLSSLADAIWQNPAWIRAVQHSTGIILIFNRRRSHVTMLYPHEWSILTDMLAVTADGKISGNG